MLNYSIDDIESLVTALNKAAEANRELQQMKASENKKGSKSKGSTSSKKSNKKNGTYEKGVRMLKARARLPPPEHFIDCFQKFKFCFNLLVSVFLMTVTFVSPNQACPGGVYPKTFRLDSSYSES